MRSVLIAFTVCIAAASGPTPEAVVLGGPCLPETGFPSDLVRRYSQEARRANREAALELNKQIVRHACSNEHWWLTLAQSLVELRRMDEAVRALDAYYARGGANAVQARLRDTEFPLHKITATPAYRKSSLAKKVEQDRAALAKRRAQAQPRLASEPHPPSEYVAKKACPFECCVFRSWSVKADTDLYDKPNGTKIVGRARKGARVTGVTGEVHLRPAPVLVRFGSPEGFTAKPGTIVYLLNYTGEGHGNVWTSGKIVDGEVMSVADHCPQPDKQCWGEFINPEDVGTQRKHVWWVKVKLRSGVIGWTKQTENFGDMDACG